MIDEAPEGEIPRDLPVQPAVFAPEVDPGWIAEIAVELRKKARLPKEASGEVVNGAASSEQIPRSSAAKKPTRAPRNRVRSPWAAAKRSAMASALAGRFEQTLRRARLRRSERVGLLNSSSANNHSRRLSPLEPGKALNMMRIGCSGWSYAQWQGRLYPSSLRASRWLERYAECFDTVEVNATFYRLPPRGTVARWAEITPDRFCFAVKGSRYLTHVRRLRDLPDGVARLVELLEPLSASGKLGPLLWQLPPTFRRDDERLATALAALPRGRQALEFRDPSWFTEDVYSLLREHKVALVIADRAGLPEAPWVDTAGWWYLRFHHGRSGRRGNYSAAELRRWADRIAAVTQDVYCYFNNDWEGFAVDNATLLRRLIART